MERGLGFSKPSRKVYLRVLHVFGGVPVAKNMNFLIRGRDSLYSFQGYFGCIHEASLVKVMGNDNSVTLAVTIQI